ncbi:MAG: ribose-5-phosphate isomerase RpiA [Crenarchaeota archaeon]|nr:ribose-5-phosphate isomerase RpiA [Thermoproteota archaeon]
MEDMKMRVAKYAANMVESDQVIGVGSGSTSMLFLRFLAERIQRREIRNISLVPTSSEVEYYSTLLKIEKYIVQPWQVDHIDVAVDGADEVDPRKNLIKGGGGALTGEKIVDYNAREFIVIVDETKLVEKLGSRVPVPVEVVSRYWRLVKDRIERELGGECLLRVLEKGKRGPLVTDNGNYLLDWKIVLDEDPEKIEVILKSIPGVVECGIFSSRHVSRVVVCNNDGEIMELK